MTPFHGYADAALKFLSDLSANNRKEWFEAHRSLYESEVLDPSLALIGEFAPRLERISPHFLAVPRRVGGSLLRIHRDTRFSRGKAPYKTNIGIHFKHKAGKDIHAPGFYVHIEPGQVFLGVGCWRPDAPTLSKFRRAIERNSIAWLKARDDRGFRKLFRLEGETLSRPPKGYSADHPMIEDIRRKDHTAIRSLDAEAARSRKFLATLEKTFSAASPYMDFLCKALDIPF